ncbi:glycerate kinase [Gordonia araii NBRC 100433]|uniref:Glycerate kinase n=1 Tax=Gordonia araii NBRC 100433 TaxID=1073574 RepID=G7H641_9ACTN|nr:glycerate kinase [Gordonia araii]NNG98721.1 glycerate kinase [Gordonia araii NBRC 100433]GAB11280.1 glycerate kinase [Gordonia araii NBRC 100433]
MLPDVVVDEIPLVDGGEGSAAALAAATGGRLVPVTVTGPVGLPVDSHFALFGGTGPRTAVVEMAAAAGLSLVPRDSRDPTVTTSFGVGQLISAALDAGATRILVGCGDSGICDGGVGALQALGVRVIDAMGDELGRGGAALSEVESIDVSGLDPRIAGVDVLVAVNPYNVLCGESGVARVFGPQKGATPDQVEQLSAAMERWAKVLERDLHVDLRAVPGSGASGGLGAGLAAALGARLLPRFEVMIGSVHLDEAISRADLVITAEGSVDGQTTRGKVPGEVARVAAGYGKPVVALAGTIGPDADVSYDAGIGGVASILPGPTTLEDAIDRGPEFLCDAAERVMRLVQIGRGLA